VCALFLVGGGNAFAQGAPPAGGWTAADCSTCHDTAVNAAFEHSAHARQDQACAKCHKNVSEHFQAKAAGAADAPNPSLKKISAKELNDICLSCHEKAKQASWYGGMHERRDLACTSCHSIHNYKSAKAQLKTVKDSETCYTCHKQMRAKMQRTSHHPVREGKMDCSSCHNPHDSTQPKMVSAASVNDKCYECHTEKRGPFMWEHAPVRENCVQCHDPHGSNHPRMTVAKQPQLCQRCHMLSGHQGVLFDATSGVGGPTVAAPAVNGVNQIAISLRTLNRGCPNCHITTHGSNAPGGVFYTR
jgi:DmsE family decaheme c-type cytochrome